MTNDIEKAGRFTRPRLFGYQTVYGFFTQVWIGRLRLHVFLKPDPGEAMHDHPWSFTSLPLVSYVEEMVDEATGDVRTNVVRAFRLNSRPATLAHRYLGKWSGKGDAVVPGVVITLCWRGRGGRSWQYVRFHKGSLRRYPWRAYLRHIGQLPSRHE